MKRYKHWMRGCRAFMGRMSNLWIRYAGQRKWIDPLAHAWVLTLAMLLGIGMADAQAEPLTLAALQQRAVENRQLVQKFQANLKQGELDTRIAQGNFLPFLDAAYIANQLNEDSAFENEQNSRFSAVASYNLFAGFQDKYNLKSAEHMEKAKAFELDVVIDDLKLAVALRYLDVYRRLENEKVAREQLKLLQKRYQDAQKRHSVGLIRKNDLLRLKVEMDDTRQRLTETRAEYVKSINQLEFATRSAIATDALAFKEFDSIPDIYNFDYYYPIMLDKRSEIKALEMVALAQENRAQALNSAYWPSVGVAAGYTRYGDNFVLGDRVRDQDEVRVTLEARINLFDGLKKGNRVARARLETRKAQYDLAELKQALETALKNILVDYDVGRKNLKVAEGEIVQAEENLRVTDIAYKEGLETSTELLDSIFFYSRAQLNQIVARIDLFSNHYRLQRMVGQL